MDTGEWTADMVTDDTPPPSPDLLAALRKKFDGVARVLTPAEWEEIRARETPPTPEEMTAVVDIAIDALQGLYVHIDLKRARRGVDPVQQLTVLRERLSAATTARAFHESMLRIFKSLGDAHTAYRLPAPHSSAIAFLPFLINAYARDNGTRGYVVSHVLPEGSASGAVPFGRGVEITTWNGVAIEEAVTAATEFEEGSNTPHDLLLTLQFMTVRWLGASFGPTSPWVVVGYRGDDGADREYRFHWLTLLFNRDPQIVASAQAVDTLFVPFRSVHARERALDIGSASVHMGRLTLFGPPAATAQTRASELERLGRSFMTKFYGYFDRDGMRAFTDNEPQLRRPDGSDEYPTLLPMFLVVREHTVKDVIAHARVPPPPGLASIAHQRMGYIGIRAFPMKEFARELFLYELRRLLNLMPAGGLVLDIRDNPGGSANLAEESLQLLTPRPITPLPFRFTVSRATKKIAEAGVFTDYAASVSTAMTMGGRFSAGRPITSIRHANEVGQHYFGPVVLVTNAATYSAADIFAAGFLDHEIGRVVGLDDTTGAGGANCWLYNDEVTIALNGAKRLPLGINMLIAVRQCTRVGRDNEGVPIEEIGVPPTVRCQLTRDDILEERPWRLLLTAGAELSKDERPRVDLSTSLAESAGTRVVHVQTVGIDRLDFFVNGRPSSVDVDGAQKQGGPAGQTTASPPLPLQDRVELEIRGYVRPDTLVARYVQVFPFRM